MFYTSFIYIIKWKLFAWSSLLLGPSRLKTGSELSQAWVRFVLGPKNTKGPSCLGSELSGYHATYQVSWKSSHWFWRRKFLKVFAIYSHGGHLGHVTWTIYINFRSPFLRMLHMKFGFDWPSSFRGEDL